MASDSLAPDDREVPGGLWWRGLVAGACAGACVGLADALLAIWAGNEVVRARDVLEVVLFYAWCFAPCGLVASFVARRFEWAYRAVALLVCIGATAFLVAGWLNVHFLPGFTSATSLFVDLVIAVLAVMWFRRAYHGPGSDEVRWPRWLGAAVVALLIAGALRFAPEDTGDAELFARAPTDSPKPNVLLYVADTLRADHLGVYGYERPTSREIDEFAKDAVVFEDCRSTTSWTKPAVASLFTSLYPTSHACVQQREVLVEEATTLPEVFYAAGWRTGAFSANPFVSPEFGLGQGFERFDRPRPSVVANGTLLGKALFMTRMLSLVGKPFGVGKVTGEPCRTLHDAALSWLRDVGDDPWFAYVHVMEPHLPYDPPAADAEAVGFPAGEPYERPPAYNGVLPLETAPEPPAGLREKLVSQYDGEIRDMSRGFGELLDGLRELGELDDTIVIFLSDHGEEFHEHGGWTHGHSLHPEVIRVPLIVRLPEALGAAAADRGRRVTGVASLLDVFPTLLDVCQIRYPRGDGPGFTGRTLAPQLLRDGAARPRGGIEDGRALLAEVTMGPVSLRSLRDGRWHYVRTEAPFAEAERLYDAVSDPREERDRLERETSTALGLRTKLLSSFRALRELALTRAEREIDAETAAQLEALGYVGGK